MFNKLGISAAQMPWVITAVAMIFVFGYLLTRNVSAF